MVSLEIICRMMQWTIWNEDTIYCFQHITFTFTPKKTNNDHFCRDVNVFLRRVQEIFIRVEGTLGQARSECKSPHFKKYSCQKNLIDRYLMLSFNKGTSSQFSAPKFSVRWFFHKNNFPTLRDGLFSKKLVHMLY